MKIVFQMHCIAIEIILVLVGEGVVLFELMVLFLLVVAAVDDQSKSYSKDENKHRILTKHV